MKRFFRKNKFTRSAGFTLIEMLTTLVIFSIMTGVVLFNQNKFDSIVLLNNLAYDVAITIRQAQTYGINVREFKTGSGDFVGYGVKIGVANNKAFVLFADTNSDLKFSGDFSCPQNDLECVERYALKRGNIIQSICADANESKCDPQGVQSLTISFKRPEPDAIIIKDDDVKKPKAYAKIVLSSPGGSQKSVIIRSTGQIYVE